MDEGYLSSLLDIYGLYIRDNIINITPVDRRAAKGAMLDQVLGDAKDQFWETYLSPEMNFSEWRSETPERSGYYWITHDELEELGDPPMVCEVRVHRDGTEHIHLLGSECWHKSEFRNPKFKPCL